MIDKNNRLFLSVRSEIHVVQLTDPRGQGEVIEVGLNTPKGELHFAGRGYKDFHCLGVYDCEASSALDSNDSLRCIIDNQCRLDFNQIVTSVAKDDPTKLVIELNMMNELHDLERYADFDDCIVDFRHVVFDDRDEATVTRRKSGKADIYWNR